MSPLITTVIPTYRRPALLRRAIGSVLAQTYPHVRVCVYDNASGDETADVVAAIAARDRRVVYHCHPQNIGGFANFAHGLAAVDTEYFSFLSDDDVLLPDFYSEAIAALEPRLDAAFWGGQAIVMREDGTIKDATDWPSASFSPPDGVLAMIRNNYLIWTSVLFRTSQVADLGGLDAEVGAAIDTDFLLRVAAERAYITSDRPAAIFMSHAESSTVLARLDFIWPGWLKLMGKLTSNENLPGPVRRDVERFLTDQLKRQLFQVGCNSIRQMKLADAREVAGILRDTYGWRAKADLLSRLASLLARFPTAHAPLMVADRARARFGGEARRKSDRLQGHLGGYAHFIELP